MSSQQHSICNDYDLDWLAVWEWLAIKRTARRSLRRHHRERLQKARADYWGMKRWEYAFGPATPKQLGVVVDTPKPCSCFQCGNPRKYRDRPRLRDRKALEESSHG